MLDHVSTFRSLPVAFGAAAATAAIALVLTHAQPALAGKAAVAACIGLAKSTAPAQDLSDWMADQIGGGRTHFIVVPAPSGSTVCSW